MFQVLATHVSRLEAAYAKRGQTIESGVAVMRSELLELLGQNYDYEVDNIGSNTVLYFYLAIA